MYLTRWRLLTRYPQRMSETYRSGSLAQSTKTWEQFRHSCYASSELMQQFPHSGSDLKNASNEYIGFSAHGRPATTRRKHNQTRNPTGRPLASLRGRLSAPCGVCRERHCPGLAGHLAQSGSSVLEWTEGLLSSS